MSRPALRVPVASAILAVAGAVLVAPAQLAPAAHGDSSVDQAQAIVIRGCTSPDPTWKWKGVPCDR